MVNKKNTSEFKIISLSKLAAASKMDYNFLYNNLRGRYSSMTDSQKREITNILHGELEAMAEFLNVKIILRPVK